MGKGPPGIKIMHVNCPRDGKDLVPFDLGGVALDRCPACSGIWFDRGEFETVKKAPGAAPGKDIGTLTPATGGPLIRACPKCGGRMVRFNYAQTVGGSLPLDRCQACAGYWFDGGELDLAISPAKPAAGSADPQALASLLWEISTLKTRG